MPEGFPQTTDQEKTYERQEATPLSPEKQSQNQEQLEHDIWLSLQHIEHIQKQLPDLQQQLNALPTSILQDSHLGPQALDLQNKITTYIQNSGAIQTYATDIPAPKAKEKLGKGIDITQEIAQISLNKQFQLKPSIGANIWGSATPWGIAGVSIIDKENNISNDLKTEFKTKGKPGQEYIATKITNQVKAPLSKTQSVMLMWGVDDGQATMWVGYQQKLDNGNLNISSTLTDTEKWPQNIKLEAGYTNKKNTFTISGTTERKKGDWSGGVSAKVRF